MDVAKAISRFEPVTVGADPELVSQARAALPPEVEVVGIPQDDSWFRDTGPLVSVENMAHGIDRCAHVSEQQRNKDSLTVIC